MDLAFEEAERAENLMLHEDEIAARPARTWYVHHLLQSIITYTLYPYNMLTVPLMLHFVLPEIDNIITFIMQVSDRNPEERC